MNHVKKQLFVKSESEEKTAEPDIKLKKVKSPEKTKEKEEPKAKRRPTSSNSLRSEGHKRVKQSASEEKAAEPTLQNGSLQTAGTLCIDLTLDDD